MNGRLSPPSPLEGISQHREAATDQPDGQYEPDSYDPEQGEVRHSASEPTIPAPSAGGLSGAGGGQLIAGVQTA